MDGDDGVLRLRDVNAAHFERPRDVRLPVRAVEQRHCAEALEFENDHYCIEYIDANLVHHAMRLYTDVVNIPSIYYIDRYAVV